MSAPTYNGEPRPSEVILAGIEAALIATRTHAPGVIEAYDRTTRLARVRVLHKRVRVNEDGSEEAIAIPPIENVPVHAIRAGGMRISLPVSAGDPCSLYVSDRALDRWKKTRAGESVDPGPGRHHDVNDVWAVPGLVSPFQAELEAADPASNLVVGTIDRVAELVIEPDGTVTMNGLALHLGTGTRAAAARVGDSITIDADTAFNLFAWILSMTTAVRALGGVIPEPPSVIAGRVSSGSGVVDVA